MAQIEAAKEIVYERIFAWVDEQNEYCQSCDMRECTDDAYATGDSPTMCECLASDQTECWAVDVELDKNYGEWFEEFVE